MALQQSNEAALVDAHCHLQDHRLPDCPAVLQRARQAGVDRMVCCGTSEFDWRRVESLCRLNSALIPAFGVHPWYAAQRTPQWNTLLRALLEKTPHAGVGEIGLDHALPDRDEEDQTTLFKEQLLLARELGRAASVHCRQAWGTLLQVLAHVGPLSLGFVVHSYSGSRELIPQLMSYGAYFSFSGSITYDRNKRGRAALVAVPADRLLIETDAPDIMPVGHGKDAYNEPANLVEILQVVASLREMPQARMAESLHANACRLFLQQ